MSRLLAVASIISIAGGAYADALPKRHAGERMIQLSSYPMTDWGERVAACLNDLPADGGICDDRSNGGPQTMAHGLVIAKNNVQILLSATSIRLRKDVVLQITANNVSLIGIGKQATTFGLEEHARLAIGSSAAIARKWTLQGFGITNAAGDRGAAGLILENAREGRLQDMLIYGFNNGSGAVVGANCWTVLVDDLNVSGNHTGFAFKGTQLNAWAIRSSLFVLNTVGVLFDLGTGSAQGVSFTGGTHFEGNSRAGILLQSGDVHEIGISNAYVETYAGQRFVEMHGDAAPIRIRAFDYSGGHIYTKDQPPFNFIARPGDFIRASIRGLYFASSTPDTPAAVFDGATASGLLIGTLVSDAKTVFAKATVSNRNGGMGVTSAGTTDDRARRSAPLMFGPWAGSDCQDRTVDLPGTALGSAVSVGVPAAFAEITGLQFTAFASERDRVTVRGCKITPGSTSRVIRGVFQLTSLGE